MHLNYRSQRAFRISVITRKFKKIWRSKMFVTSVYCFALYTCFYEAITEQSHKETLAGRIASLKFSLYSIKSATANRSLSCKRDFKFFVDKVAHYATRINAGFTLSFAAQSLRLENQCRTARISYTHTVWLTKRCMKPS